MAELPTLSSIRFALERELEKELTSAALFTSLNTRLIIRTGVNLKKIQPEQNAERMEQQRHPDPGFRVRAGR